MNFHLTLIPKSARQRSSLGSVGVSTNDPSLQIAARRRKIYVVTGYPNADIRAADQVAWKIIESSVVFNVVDLWTDANLQIVIPNARLERSIRSRGAADWAGCDLLTLTISPVMPTAALADAANDTMAAAQSIRVKSFVITSPCLLRDWSFLSR